MLVVGIVGFASSTARAAESIDPEQVRRDRLEDGAQRLQTTGKLLHAFCPEPKGGEEDEGGTKGGDGGERETKGEGIIAIDPDELEAALLRTLPNTPKKKLDEEYVATLEVLAELDPSVVDAYLGVPSTSGDPTAPPIVRREPDSEPDWRFILEEADKREGLGTIVDGAKKKVEFEDGTCEQYCRFDGVNLCALHDDLDLARVVYGVDPVSAERALDHIETKKKTAEPLDLLDPELKIKLRSHHEAFDVVPSSAGRGGIVAGLGGLLGGGSAAQAATELALRFAVALGELAIDRAKQEGVLWALEQLGTRLCDRGSGRSEQELLAREISTFWLPQVCALTRDENLQSGFGAGQAMLSALVSAVENDGKHLPGAAGGLLVGLVYWLDDTEAIDDEIPTPFDCAQGDEASPRCERTTRVRRATAGAIEGLLDGSEPVDEALRWSAELDEIGRALLDAGPEGRDGDRYVLRAPSVQLAACGMAVAAHLAADDSRQRVVAPPSDPLPDSHRLLAALTTAPACWTLVGKGHASVESAGSMHLALDRASRGDVERISTIIRLAHLIEQSRVRAGDAWREWERVAELVRGARERLSALRPRGSADSASTPKASKEGEGDSGEAGSMTERAAARLEEARQFLLATIDLADAMLDAMDATGALVEGITGEHGLPAAVPGLLVEVEATDGKCPSSGVSGETQPPCRGAPAGLDSADELTAQVRALRGRIDQAHDVLEALREVIAGDWASAGTVALRVAQRLLDGSLRIPETAVIGRLGAEIEQVRGAASLAEAYVQLGRSLNKAGRAVRKAKTARGRASGLASLATIAEQLEDAVGQAETVRDQTHEQLEALKAEAARLGVTCAAAKAGETTELPVLCVHIETSTNLEAWASRAVTAAGSAISAIERARALVRASGLGTPSDRAGTALGNVETTLEAAWKAFASDDLLASKVRRANGKAEEVKAHTKAAGRRGARRLRADADAVLARFELEVGRREDFVARLGEVVGLFTAVLSAEDTEDIAVVLEKSAAPPGGWRRKQVAGSLTVSLGAHVGAYAAAELRVGQYGVHRERGGAHLQAPTLAVPIGIDVARGVRDRNSVGVFLPLIDPAAFVQYDVSEGGRLPGPRPITVLSPGALFRWGVWGTPFTIIAGYVYRPRLRTWEATIDEPGADAHQLGGAVAIDATFWSIVKR